MNYADLKQLMELKGFVFENYGKVIKKDNFILACFNNNVSKNKAALVALKEYFLNINFSNVQMSVVNQYFNNTKGSYDFIKMLQELV
jgi:hypothetical protein